MAERKFLFMNGTEGYPEEADPTADSITLAGLTMGGDIAMAGNEVTGLPSTPSGDTAAASKAYVDSLLTGLSWKEPVQVIEMIDDSLSSPPGSPSAGDSYVVGATPSGGWSAFFQGDIVEYDGSSWNVIVSGSGGEPADGTRVAVTTGTAAGSFAGEEGEIATYSTTGSSWSFEDPEDGWAVLVVGAGAYWENTGWVWNESDTTWNQFSGAGQILAGDGLTKSGNTIDVGAGDGIAVAADSVAVDLVDSQSGLEFSSGELQVEADGAHGITRGASGLEIEIDDTPDTLDVDADGLKVVGLPSLFKINDVAVGATVTAANLDDLTDGSNADSLHTHAGAAATEAPKVEDTHTNSATVTTGRAVAWSSTNDQIVHADNGTAAIARVIGVARTGGAASPGTSEVVKHGICTGCLSGATVQTPYYLGASGNLVTFASIPRPGRIIRIGFAVNTTDLDVQIMDFGNGR